MPASHPRGILDSASNKSAIRMDDASTANKFRHVARDALFCISRVNNDRLPPMVRLAVPPIRSSDDEFPPRDPARAATRPSAATAMCIVIVSNASFAQRIVAYATNNMADERYGDAMQLF
eukprot:scaffold68199_cov60-Attheya_sp.AAC.2